MRRALESPGEDPLESVVATIAALEQDPLFNAGRGSVLSADCRVRMDASLATSDGRAGAVGDTIMASSAIRAARAVMEYSSHTLLVGSAADYWLRGRSLVSDPYLCITEDQYQLWRRWREGEDLDSLGTVGAVALHEGRLAAGTSTGGLRGKTAGRVGDSAVPGAGTWCSEEVAISFTGDGDRILARASAARVASGIIAGGDPGDVIQSELEAFAGEDADAGCIALLQDGRSWAMRNCQLMNWGKKEQGDIFVPLATE
jgi:beta-aspartyl-peptidase (threonine type)